MNVKDLKRFIEGLPDDMLVVLAKDAEGNDFSPLADSSVGYYFPATTWHGDFVGGDNDEDDRPEGECNAVCLGPVN